MNTRQKITHVRRIVDELQAHGLTETAQKVEEITIRFLNDSSDSRALLRTGKMCFASGAGFSSIERTARQEFDHMYPLSVKFFQIMYRNIHAAVGKHSADIHLLFDPRICDWELVDEAYLNLAAVLELSTKTRVLKQRALMVCFAYLMQQRRLRSTRQTS